MKTETYVPFVSEVETFNQTMGKPNTYTPNIPDRKEWEFVYNFILEELEEYKHACETGNIVEVLDALCDITYVSLGNGAMFNGFCEGINSSNILLTILSAVLLSFTLTNWFELCISSAETHCRV